ncbi:MAG: hypothetical protein ACPLPX_03890 [Candidatus Kapaibacteriota bacterium]
MYKISKLIIFLSLFIQFLSLYSQQEEIPSPLGPGIGKKQSEIGIAIGFGPNWQSGEFYASCNCPSFKEGAGSVFSLIFFYQRDLTSIFQWGASLNFSFITSSSAYKERELLIFTSQNGTTYVNIPVLFREQMDLNFTLLNVMPYLSFSPFDFAYLRLGVQAGFPISKKVKHTKELIENKVRLDNGETIVITIGNNEQYILEDGVLAQTKTSILSAVPALGFNFHLTGNIFMGISYALYFPLNNWVERGKDFKLNYWLLSFDLRYALTLRKWVNN